MKSSGNALLIFMRYPEPGKVKSRLAKGIGDEAAAEVYEKLLRRTLGIACEFERRNPGARILLFHAPTDRVDKLREGFSGPWEFRAQEGENLGLRMEKALEAAFCLGAKKAVLIGSDLANIECGDIEEAFQKLDAGSAVLGPASDGGFYLVGLMRPCSLPFRFEKWGGAEVFSRTARALDASGLRLRMAKERRDVDRAEDLAGLERDFAFHSSLSVIVPTLRGPDELEPLLGFLENSIWPGDEIILVRGAQIDSVFESTISTRIRYMLAPRGRGVQQNTGAMLACGDLFFFLHDDTRPPVDFAYLARRACSDKETALGCFRLAFAPSGRLLRSIAGWANVRTALFGRPYGDQGFFCRKEIFERAGGFQRRYLMEDVELVKKCRGLGKLMMLPVPVYSSPKRYLLKGVLRASLENHSIMLMSALGFDERKLYRRYYGLDL